MSITTNAIPINPISVKNSKSTNGDNSKEMNTAFMLLIQTLQSGEEPTLNLESLLNQSIKPDTLNSPKFKEIAEKLPEEVIAEIQQLLGNSIKEILNNAKVTPEAKIMTVIAASIQLKESQTNDSLMKQLKESVVFKPRGIKTEFNTNKVGVPNPLPSETTQKKDMTNAQNLLVDTEAEEEQSTPTKLTTGTENKLQKNVHNAASINAATATTVTPSVSTNNSTLTNRVITKTNVREIQSYGEFKIERTNTPVINLNSTSKPENTNQNFMRQFESILKSSRFSQIAKNHSQMTIQLRPDNLGFMTIKVEQVNQELIARIITSSNTTKEIIESNIQQLRHLNIQVDKFEVSAQQTNQQLRDQEQSQQQHDQEKQQEKSKKDNNEQPPQTFEEQLANILP